MIPPEATPAAMAADAAPGPVPGRAGPAGPVVITPRPLVRPLEAITIGTIVAADQFTKFAVRSAIPLYGKRVVIPNLLDLTHVQNSGAAFGVLNATDFAYKSGLMIGIATLALIAIFIYARQLGTHERLARYGLALILGGAFGNLIDRAMTGSVVDFVDVYRGEVHFWAFNVADAAITVGAILVLVEMLGFGRRHASHPV